MKKKSGVWIVLLILLCVQGLAQKSIVEPKPIAIGFSKTTNIIFPYPIKSWDVGSRYVLSQKAGGVENILQVKAGQKGFEETTLSVVTTDGCLFSYLLTYSSSPTQINVSATDSQIKQSPVAVFTAGATTDKIQSNAKKVAVKKRASVGLAQSVNGVTIALKGLYVSDDVLYLQFFLQNESTINYDIKMLRLFIHDKKIPKRTASQEIDVAPLYVLGDVKRIPALSEQTLVIALQKFTIPDKKRLEIELMEADGGRNLKLRFNGKSLMNPKLIE